VQTALTIIALSLWIILFLGLLSLTCVVYLLVSIWKENRFGIIWFTLAVVGFCAIALFAGYI